MKTMTLPQMLNSLFRLSLAIVLLGAAAPALRADVIISDAFNGAAGSLIPGTSPSGVGSPLQWAAYGDGQTSFITSPTAGMASLAGASGGRGATIELPSLPGGTNLLSVQASITLANPTFGSTVDGNGWGGVNLSNESNSPYGRLIGLVETNGTVSIFANFAQTSVASGSIAGFSLTSTYTLTLTYDLIASTASLSINNVEIIAPTAVSLGGGALNRAGFASANEKLPYGTVDNFVVSAVPEPSVYALLVLGGFAILFRRRLVNRSIERI